MTVAPEAVPRRLLGVDFSAAVDAGRKMWLAGGTLTGNEAVITYIAPIGRLLARDDALLALRSRIDGAGPLVVGMDVSLGLPVAVWAGPWLDLLQQCGAAFSTAGEFRAWCRSRVGGRELRRVTDGAVRTPMSPYNLRVYRQTYHALCDVVSPLVASNAACVLPMQPAVADIPWLIEVCPASTLRRLGLLRRYKGSSRMPRASRESILVALETQYGLQLAPSVDKGLLISDSSGNALDAVLAAATVAWVLRSPEDLHEMPDTVTAIEGRVYVPRSDFGANTG